MAEKHTIYALSSGRPPAAIAIVRISGPRAHEAGRSMTGTLPAARRAGMRNLRHPATGELLDRAIVLRFDGPETSTGEDLVEFHCHGGRAVISAVLGALADMEALREATPGEFTRRAFENGRIDLTQAEGLADLLEAETEVQRKAAIRVAEGDLRRQIEDWRRRVLLIAATVERAIDYDDDDLALDPSVVLDCSKLAQELSEWLRRPRIEPLRDGVKFVIAGPPNSGKSSLINRIAGSEKAIVTDVPGTTRDSIDVPLSLGGIPVCLTDTAGLRQTDDRVEAIGVERARKLVDAADVLLWLGEGELSADHPRVINLYPKADLEGRDQPPAGFISVSSVTGQGLGDLLERMIALARDMLPGEDQLALNHRQSVQLERATAALAAASATESVVLCAEELREARVAFDRLTGQASVEDMLDALFGRFCLGK